MCKYCDMIASVLLVIGGLNWGLVAFFDMNLVTMFFGGTMVSNFIYGLITVAAFYTAYSWKNCCCSK